MDTVPRKGVACGSGVVEEKSDPEPMPVVLVTSEEWKG